MTPKQLLEDPEWIDYALMSEGVEGEISNPKKDSSGQDAIVFNIIPPDEGESGAPAHVGL
jgi:hypothetical protein